VRARAENEIKSSHFPGQAFREAKLWPFRHLDGAAWSSSAFVGKALKVPDINAASSVDAQRIPKRR
jgi:hypothetical protein